MRKNNTYWIFAIILGIGIGIYTVNEILKRSRVKEATVELEEWMPASEKVTKIYEHLNDEGRLVLQSVARAACFCAQNNEVILEEDIEQIDYLNMIELQTIVMPFLKCMTDEVDEEIIESVNKDLLDGEAKYYYDQLSEEEKSEVYVFLFLLEMKTSCVEDAYLVSTVVKRVFELQNN